MFSEGLWFATYCQPIDWQQIRPTHRSLVDPPRERSLGSQLRALNQDRMQERVGTISGAFRFKELAIRNGNK